VPDRRQLFGASVQVRPAAADAECAGAVDGELIRGVTVSKKLILARTCLATSFQLAIVLGAHAQSTPTWTYTVPNQAAEQATYDNVLHWAWTSSDKVFNFPATYQGPVNQAGLDIHNDTEGDDVWTHYQMYLRTGDPHYKVWATGWRNYFVGGYYQTDISATGPHAGASDQDYLYDHLYGIGLVLYAHYENDPAALAKAVELGGIVESAATSITPGSSSMAYYGSRRRARQTLLAIYLAQETGDSRWITLRDKLINAWVQSPDWQAGAAGGMYFVSREQMPSSHTTDAAYVAGQRVNSAFQIGLHSEALWRAYLATGRTDVRAKLIAMAQWVKYYAHDPSYVMPMTGDWFGQQGDLSRWHDNPDSGSANVKGADPSYDTSLVNTMVIGYKLTGDNSMLDFAKVLFRTGTIFSAGHPSETPGSVTKLVADNEVSHYVDTLHNPDTWSDYFLFDYNKGELQYSYLLFENGGNPIVMGNVIAPRAPTNLTAQ
jgi:hypothetical protein